MKNNVINEDNTIDIFNLARIFFLNISLLIKYSLVFLIVVLIFNELVDPKFQARASFFIPQDSTNQNLFSSYNKFTGKNLDSPIESNIASIVQSQNIREKIVTAYNERHKELSRDDIEENLDLEKTVILEKDRNNLFILIYQHSNKATAKWVLEQYLHLLYQFNEEFDLNAERQIISVLDKPNVFEKPVYPKKIINIIFAFCLAFLSTSVHIWAKVSFLPFIKEVISNKTPASS